MATIELGPSHAFFSSLLSLRRADRSVGPPGVFADPVLAQNAR
jgi:hypothetical protein